MSSFEALPFFHASVYESAGLQELLSGGLLGSLLFGQPFTGPNSVDILVLLALGLVLFRLIARRGGAERDAQPRQRPEIGHDRSPEPEQDEDEITQREASERYRRAAHAWNHLSTKQSDHTPPAPRGKAGSETPDYVIEKLEGLPKGFDVDDFLQGAKAFYIRFMDSWDNRDLDDLAQFTTPDMYRQLQRQAENNPDKTVTHVLMLEARPVEIREEGQYTLARVSYDALLREDKAQQPRQAHELWRFSRDESRSGATWRLEAIERMQ